MHAGASFHSEINVASPQSWDRSLEDAADFPPDEIYEHEPNTEFDLKAFPELACLEIMPPGGEGVWTSVDLKAIASKEATGGKSTTGKLNKKRKNKAKVSEKKRRKSKHDRFAVARIGVGMENSIKKKKSTPPQYQNKNAEDTFDYPSKWIAEEHKDYDHESAKFDLEDFADLLYFDLMHPGINGMLNPLNPSADTGWEARGRAANAGCKSRNGSDKKPAEAPQDFLDLTCLDDMPPLVEGVRRYVDLKADAIWEARGQEVTRKENKKRKKRAQVAAKMGDKRRKRVLDAFGIAKTNKEKSPKILKTPKNRNTNNILSGTLFTDLYGSSRLLSPCRANVRVSISLKDQEREPHVFPKEKSVKELSDATVWTKESFTGTVCDILPVGIPEMAELSNKFKLLSMNMNLEGIEEIPTDLSEHSNKFKPPNLTFIYEENYPLANDFPKLQNDTRLASLKPSRKEAAAQPTDMPELLDEPNCPDLEPSHKKIAPPSTDLLEILYNLKLPSTKLSWKETDHIPTDPSELSDEFNLPSAALSCEEIHTLRTVFSERPNEIKLLSIESSCEGCSPPPQ